MDKKKIISKVIEKLSKPENKDEGSSAIRFINDLSKEQEVKERKKTEKLIQNTIGPFTTGTYRDEYWKPIKEIIKEIEKHKVEPILTNTEYYKNPNQTPKISPDGKKWYYDIPFSNMGGWKLTLTSHFGPSKVDPKNPKEHLSDAYDLTFNLGWDKNVGVGRFAGIADDMRIDSLKRYNDQRYSKYVGKIYDEIEKILDADRSDAQGIVDGQIKTLWKCWEKGLSVEQAAKKIDKASTIKD